ASASHSAVRASARGEAAARSWPGESWESSRSGANAAEVGAQRLAGDAAEPARLHRGEPVLADEFVDQTEAHREQPGDVSHVEEEGEFVPVNDAGVGVLRGGHEVSVLGCGRCGVALRHVAAGVPHARSLPHDVQPTVRLYNNVTAKMKVRFAAE